VSEDIIHRFSFNDAPIRGQWVRLAETLAQAPHRASQPLPAQCLLAEMLAAVSLMADGIKFNGRVALQARGDGPVGTALAECRHRSLLRGIVRWDEDADPPTVAANAGVLGSEPALSTLLGAGQMVITLTPQDDDGQQSAYQGVVAITDDSLARNLEGYFADSEQLPTRLFIAFADDTVTGLLLQRLPADATAPFGEEWRDETWREIELLAQTVTAEELATLPVDRLLHRLFHEHPHTVHPGRTLEFSCTCSRERAEQMLQALPKGEILELLETRGMVDVTCEICGARYEYDEVDTHLLYEPGERRLH
jgi:molecular chaperone Hsp33